MKHIARNLVWTGQYTALACAAALAMASTSSVQAQQSGVTAGKVTFPAGLQWQMMPVVSFNFPVKSGTPAERRLAEQVWKKELADLPSREFHDRVSQYPAFILVGAVEDQARRYIFSGLSAAYVAYPECENPPNGGDEHTPTWSTCPMRVVVQDKATGAKLMQEDFPDYCLLSSHGPDDPPSENRTELAFDHTTKTAYFRVLQYGKHVKSCDRAIRFQ